jgi:hypothetical protein
MRMKRKMAILVACMLPFIGFAQQYHRTKKNTGFRIEAGAFDMGKKDWSGFNLEIGQYYSLGIYRTFERINTQVGLNYVLHDFAPKSDSLDQLSSFNDIMHSVQVPLLVDLFLFGFGVGHSRYYECTYFDFYTILGPDLAYNFSGIKAPGQSEVALNGNLGLGLNITKSGASRRNASWEGTAYVVYKRGITPMANISGGKYFSDYLGFMFTLTHFKTYKWSNM